MGNQLTSCTGPKDQGVVDPMKPNTKPNWGLTEAAQANWNPLESR